MSCPSVSQAVPSFRSDGLRLAGPINAHREGRIVKRVPDGAVPVQIDNSL